MSGYILAQFDDEAAAISALGSLVTDTSRAVAVTAYTHLATTEETDGGVQVLTPAVAADGYWLLYADESGADPLTLPPGIVGISPLFAGMAVN